MPVPVADLSTDRLLLSPPVEADAPDIARLADNYEIASRLSRLPHPYGLSDARRFLREIAPKGAVWAIRRAEDGAFMGLVGLTPCEPPADAELGYWLGEPFWGRGFGAEAAGAVVAHADACGRRSLHAGCFAFNAASAALLKRLGFAETGRTRRGNGVFEGERELILFLRRPTA